MQLGSQSSLLEVVTQPLPPNLSLPASDSPLSLCGLDESWETSSDASTNASSSSSAASAASDDSWHSFSSGSSPPRRTTRGTRGGSRRRRHSSFVILSANVTSWSPKSRAHLRHLSAPVTCVQEHHWASAAAAKAITELRTQRFDVHYTLAIASENGGTQGGALVMLQHHLASSPLRGATLVAGGWKSPYSKVAGAQLSCQGHDILVLSGYHRGGLDPSLMDEVARATLGGTLPFILACDWNCTPEEVTAAGWPQSLLATLAVVAAPQTTCNSSRGAPSRIDFFLVSAFLVFRCQRRLVRLGGAMEPSCSPEDFRGARPSHYSGASVSPTSTAPPLGARPSCRHRVGRGTRFGVVSSRRPCSRTRTQLSPRRAPR